MGKSYRFNKYDDDDSYNSKRNKRREQSIREQKKTKHKKKFDHLRVNDRDREPDNIEDDLNPMAWEQ